MLRMLWLIEDVLASESGNFYSRCILELLISEC